MAMTVPVMTPVPFAVVVPGRAGAVSVDHRVYLRRRLVAALVLSMIVLVLLVGAGRVLASRGGAPASAPAAPPAAAASASVTWYVVRAGDTLWSIAEEFHGTRSVAEYVDTLVRRNGGSDLAIGQQLALP